MRPPEPAEPPKKKGRPEEGDDLQLTSKAPPPMRPELPRRRSQAVGETTPAGNKAPKTEAWKGEVYGCWTHDPKNLGSRPRALLLFSGPPRAGDMSEQLKALGWAVCSCDTLQEHPTDLLDQGVRKAILADIGNYVYDSVFLGTPCETYSALRSIPPGPRPLRTGAEITGISHGLNAKEKKQLEEGNQHTGFSSRVMHQAHTYLVPFTMENPEPINEVSIFKMPEVVSVAELREVKDTNFDQCRFGCEARKPTRLLHYGVVYSELSELRCDHPVQSFVDSKGQPYQASHERVAQRKRTKSDGSWEYASKALGNYTPELCKALAAAMAGVKSGRSDAARELRSQPIP